MRQEITRNQVIDVYYVIDEFKKVVEDNDLTKLPEILELSKEIKEATSNNVVSGGDGVSPSDLVPLVERLIALQESVDAARAEIEENKPVYEQPGSDGLGIELAKISDELGKLNSKHKTINDNFTKINDGYGKLLDNYRTIKGGSGTTIVIDKSAYIPLAVIGVVMFALGALIF